MGGCSQQVDTRATGTGVRIRNKQYKIVPYCYKILFLVSDQARHAPASTAYSSEAATITSLDI